MESIRRRGFTLLLVLLLLGGGGYFLWGEYDRIRGLKDYEEAERIADACPDEPPAIQDAYAAALSGIDLGALREINSDVAGWIELPETGLSYPVLRAADNQYYLNRTWMGERSAVGAVFLECQCKADFSDFNAILYGHRMRDDSMFGVLRHYEEQEFWQAHPSVYLVTDEGISRYDVFSAREASVKGIVYRLDLEESSLQEEFIRDCVEASVIDTGIVPEADGHILTLSTCTAHGYANRWVVHAVLVETFPV